MSFMVCGLNLQNNKKKEQLFIAVPFDHPVGVGDTEFSRTAEILATADGLVLQDVDQPPVVKSFGKGFPAGERSGEICRCFLEFTHGAIYVTAVVICKIKL